MEDGAVFVEWGLCMRHAVTILCFVFGGEIWESFHAYTRFTRVCGVYSSNDNPRLVGLFDVNPRVKMG
jgi:hypothetical protein